MGVIFYQKHGSTKRGGRSGVAGFTLVEMLVVITIGAVLAALAVPGFVDMGDKRRIEGPAEALYADMQFAKSEALKRGRPVRIVFTRDMSGVPWCYGMTHAATCDCTVTDTTAANYCYLDIDQDGLAADVGTSEPVRINGSDRWPGVEMQTMTYTSGTLTFTPPYATANAGNVEYLSDRGKLMRIVTAGIGRIRICSPAGSGKMWAYKACT